MVQIEIRDGDPWWYLSPDIWVVPGDDPLGSVGTPIAGMPAFVWAHLTNHAAFAIPNVRVDFYWAVPTPQILRPANSIGSAFADLARAGDPGSEADVLCLTPWPVTMVNSGHECLIAEAVYPGSSVPGSLAYFDAGYPEIAQKNLTVLAASMAALPLTITIAAGSRHRKLARLVIETGQKLDPRSLRSLGLPRDLRPAKGRVVAGLSARPRCAKGDAAVGEEKLSIEVAAGTAAAGYLTIGAAELTEGEYALVNVLEFNGDGERPVGGCAFVVVADATLVARRPSRGKDEAK